jgi:hypothetical protein
MTGMKILSIVLVFVVVLFIGFVVWGTSPKVGQTTDPHVFNKQPHPILGALNGVLAPFSPKLDLTQKTFDLSSASPISPVVVKIPADTDHKFRISKFHLTPASVSGCAKIEYKAPNDDGDELGKVLPNPQQWPGSSDDPTQVSFTILQSGGNITFTHQGPPLQRCIVQLE